MGLKSKVKSNIFLYRIAIWLFRIRQATRFSIVRPRTTLKWLYTSREHTNFTYDLSPTNQRALAYFGASLCGVGVAEIQQYFNELSSDQELAEYIRQRVKSNRLGFTSDLAAKYGKRALYYAITRVKKPELIVESGIDKGLSTCVIAAALNRNESEGTVGKLIAIDIDESAGWLLGGSYSRNVTLIYGSSHDAIRDISGPIDLFIYDSLGDSNYELEEYELARSALRDKAIVFSIYGGATPAMMDFAESFGGMYSSWDEVPVEHPYPGRALGAVVFKTGSLRAHD